MSDSIYLELKDGSVLCDESTSRKLVEQNTYTGVCHHTLKDGLILSLRDLIGYALSMNYEFEMPEGYKYKKIYNITFNCANLEPESRRCSTCNSSILYSSEDYDFIINKFNYLCNSVEKPTDRKNKRWFCWHTEEYSQNQIIHSYNISESYIVYKDDKSLMIHYTNLRQCFSKLIEAILGKDYYNTACDTYTCDKLACEDMLYTLKHNTRRKYKKNIKEIE